MSNIQLKKLTGIENKIDADKTNIIKNLLGEYKKMTDDKNKMTVQIEQCTMIRGQNNNFEDQPTETCKIIIGEDDINVD